MNSHNLPLLLQTTNPRLISIKGCKATRQPSCQRLLDFPCSSEFQTAGESSFFFFFLPTGKYFFKFFFFTNFPRKRPKRAVLPRPALSFSLSLSRVCNLQPGAELLQSLATSFLPSAYPSLQYPPRRRGEESSAKYECAA